MSMSVDVSASKANISRYHSLLTSEWTKRTLEDVLSLLWAEIAESEGVQNLPFRDVLKPEPGKAARREPNSSVVDHIRTFASFFDRRALPAMPAVEASAGVRGGRATAHAEAAWTYLVLHTLVHLRGEVGFLRDTQSLLFLTAVHYLMPALKEKDRPAHDCLANALYMHTLTAWRERPEHFFYLQSTLMDSLGDEEEKERNLRLSLEVTPVDDDSYLTKLQDYWFALLDGGKPRDAWSFLLSAYRTAPQPYLEELEEMMSYVGRRLPADANASAKRR